MLNDTPVSTVTGCFIAGTFRNSKPLFDFREDGYAAVNLTDYVLIPKELFRLPILSSSGFGRVCYRLLIRRTAPQRVPPIARSLEPTEGVTIQ